MRIWMKATLGKMILRYENLNALNLHGVLLMNYPLVFELKYFELFYLDLCIIFTCKMIKQILDILHKPESVKTNAGFRLACRSPHCRFDDDICSTAQAPLAAEGWPSGKQRLANRSITLPLCPPRQTTDGWILFNSGVMPLGEKAKVAWLLRAATLKQQAMITWRSGKLVWNQHYVSWKYLQSFFTNFFFGGGTCFQGWFSVPVGDGVRLGGDLRQGQSQMRANLGVLSIK